MPVNANPEYAHAEKAFLAAKTIEEKIERLEDMLSVAPKHKSSENLLSNLKTRLKKLKEQQEKQKSSGKTKRVGIKKEDMQAVIVGFASSGKSSLLDILTNARPKISPIDFTTTQPQIGMMRYADTSIQVIENPAIESEYYDKGISNSADAIIILITKIEEIERIEKEIVRARGKKIIVFNKLDLLDQDEKRRIFSRLQSGKYNFVMISTKTEEGIDELKGKIFQSFGKLRVYTKEPGKERSNNPVIMPPRATVKDLSEKILKGFSKLVKETKIWGPSSKFPGQKVGLTHELKDLDVVEFRTK